MGKCNSVNQGMSLQLGSSSSVSSLVSRLKECGATGDLLKGRKLHTLSIKLGFISNRYLLTALIDMYAKCGCTQSALRVLQEGSLLDLVAWTYLIQGLVDNGQSELALRLFETLEANYVPDERLYVVALKACASLAGKGQLRISRRCLDRATAIHRAAVTNRCCDRFVENALLNVYFKCGSVPRARQLFDQMLEKNVVSWTTLIQGYVENGEGFTALQVFDEMESVCAPNRATYVAALSACASLGESSESWLAKGQEIHRRALSNRCCDMHVESTLIHMYAKLGRMDLARDVFERMKRRSIVTWNALIQGYVDNGESRAALGLFYALNHVSPNARTFLAAITACSQLAGAERKEEVLKEGMAIHAQVVTCSRCCDCHVETALVEMYAVLGEMKRARCVFDEMARRSVVTWTSLIKGYVENGESEVAVDVFERMTCPPDAKTFAAVIKACAASAGESECDRSKWLERGKSIHSQAVATGNRDQFVENSLIHMYAECGCMELARLVFEEMKVKNVVSWNSLIRGYLKNGCSDVALKLTCEMDVSGCRCNSETFLAALMACVNLLDVGRGRDFHAEIRFKEPSLWLETCLVSLYSKAGYMDEAEHVFGSMERRDTRAWNMLIGGYSQQGDSRRVLELFERMREEEVRPDEVTFTHLLAACNHAGETDQGKMLFTMMMSEYGISPKVTHCNCMVDMLCRANKSVDEALRLIQLMPLKPNDVTWTSMYSIIAYTNRNSRCERFL